MSMMKSLRGYATRRRHAEANLAWNGSLPPTEKYGNDQSIPRGCSKTSSDARVQQKRKLNQLDKKAETLRNRPPSMTQLLTVRSSVRRRLSLATESVSESKEHSEHTVS